MPYLIEILSEVSNELASYLSELDRNSTPEYKKLMEAREKSFKSRGLDNDNDSKTYGEIRIEQTYKSEIKKLHAKPNKVLLDAEDKAILKLSYLSMMLENDNHGLLKILNKVLQAEDVQDKYNFLMHPEAPQNKTLVSKKISKFGKLFGVLFTTPMTKVRHFEQAKILESLLKQLTPQGLKLKP